MLSLEFIPKDNPHEEVALHDHSLNDPVCKFFAFDRILPHKFFRDREGLLGKEEASLCDFDRSMTPRNFPLYGDLTAKYS